MEVSKELQDSLGDAKTRFLMADNQMFAATVMLNLDVRFDNKVPVAATDGLNIFLNSTTWALLTNRQRVFLIAHETWHVCFDHMGTRGDRDPKLWNMANDFVINYMLVYTCGMEFIEGGCLEQRFKDMDSIQVYDLIYNDPKYQQMAKTFEADVIESEGMTDDDEKSAGTTGKSSGDAQEDISRRIENIVSKAAMQADMANQTNSVPAYIRQAIEEARNPELPWDVILLNYFSEKSKDDYTWSSRNRMFKDVYMPSLEGDGMGAIRAYFDASGSITQHILDLECAELRYVKELMNPSRMVLRAFSHFMGKEQCFEKDQDITLDCDASGGTELQQVMDDIVLNNDTEIVVIFTDGEFRYPDVSKISCDIIWVITDNKTWKCPKGFKTIHMNTSKL